MTDSGITPAMRRRASAAVSDLRLTEGSDTPINETESYKRGRAFYAKLCADNGGHQMFEWNLAVCHIADSTILSFFLMGFDEAMQANSDQKEAA